MFNRDRFIMIVVLLLLMVSIIIFYQNVIKYKPVTSNVMRSENNSLLQIENQFKKVKIDHRLLSKNLFSPDRSFKEQEHEEKERQQPIEIAKTKPALQLIGIVLNRDGEYEAILKINDIDTITLRVGDKYDDIEVVEIGDRIAELNWLGESIVLTLNKVKEMGE